MYTETGETISRFLRIGLVLAIVLDVMFFVAFFLGKWGRAIKKLALTLLALVVIFLTIYLVIKVIFDVNII